MFKSRIGIALVAVVMIAGLVTGGIGCKARVHYADDKRDVTAEIGPSNPNELPKDGHWELMDDGSKVCVSPGSACVVGTT